LHVPKPEQPKEAAMKEITLEEELDLVLGPIDAPSVAEVERETDPTQPAGLADPGSEDDEEGSAEDDPDSLDED
jgi:hypothetical protein